MEACLLCFLKRLTPKQTDNLYIPVCAKPQIE